MGAIAGSPNASGSTEGILMIQTVADVVLTGLVCTAAWLDFTTHRIPNWLTVTGLAAGDDAASPARLGRL